MPTNFPAALDDDSSLLAVTDGVTSIVAAHHNNLKDAIKAVEAKIGITNGSTAAALDYRLGHPTSGHLHNAASGMGPRLSHAALLDLATANPHTQYPLLNPTGLVSPTYLGASYAATNGLFVAADGFWRIPAGSGGGGGTGRFVGCRAYNSTTQSIPNNVITALTFDSEEYDSDTMHSTSSNTSRFTVQTGLAGKYLLMAHTSFAGNSTNSRWIWFKKNGSTDITASAVNYSNLNAALRAIETAVVVDLAVGDYVEAVVLQDSGGSLAVGQATTYYSSGFEMILIGTTAANALTSSQATLGADVTMTSASTWYDGPSLSLVAGTYLVLWKGLFQQGSSGQRSVYGRLFDGTNELDYQEHTPTNANGFRSLISGHTIVTLGSTLTVKMQMQSDVSTNIMSRDGGAGASHNATKISAIRIA
jgi:hypothetical protein